MDIDLTADLFYGHCDIMRQLYKASSSLLHNQSHSYSPIRASDRVFPPQRARGLLKMPYITMFCYEMICDIVLVCVLLFGFIAMHTGLCLLSINNSCNI